MTAPQSSRAQVAGMLRGDWATLSDRPRLVGTRLSRQLARGSGLMPYCIARLSLQDGRNQQGSELGASGCGEMSRIDEIIREKPAMVGRNECDAFFVCDLGHCRCIDRPEGTKIAISHERVPAVRPVIYCQPSAGVDIRGEDGAHPLKSTQRPDCMEIATE